MLPKKARMSRAEFNRFFSLGKRHHSPTFQVVFATHPTLQTSVVVSKKIARSAVARNKIRRRIYDIVRNLRKEQEIKGAFIFFVKLEIFKVPYSQLREEVRTCVINILKRPNQKQK